MEKCEKLRRFFAKVDMIEVVFTAEKHRRKCEITVHAGHFHLAALTENGHELAAFEKALKAVERQIKDNKHRMIERRQKAVNVAKQTNRSGKTLRLFTPEFAA